MIPRSTYYSSKELLLFTQQLAAMLRAGVPLVRTLAILEAHSTSRPLRDAIHRTKQAILEGSSLHDACALSPHVFSHVYVTLVSCGERAGILEETLENLATSLERTRSMRSRIHRAMAYPAVVLLTLTAVIIFLLTWVIPTFQELFAESGIELPWLTRHVLAGSRLVSDYGSYALAIFGVVLLCSTWLSSRSTTNARFLEQITLRVPVLREIVRKSAASECALLLSALLRAGIPIIEALDIMTQTTRSSLVARELATTRNLVLNGYSLTTSLTNSTVFPAVISQMVGVGEEAGRLEEMLAKVGSFLEQELLAAIATLQDLAEPILVALIGCVVGVLVVAMYLPLFQIGELGNFG